MPLFFRRSRPPPSLERDHDLRTLPVLPPFSFPHNFFRFQAFFFPMKPLNFTLTEATSPGRCFPAAPPSPSCEDSFYSCSMRCAIGSLSSFLRKERCASLSRMIRFLFFFPFSLPSASYSIFPPVDLLLFPRFSPHFELHTPATGPFRCISWAVPSLFFCFKPSLLPFW